METDPYFGLRIKKDSKAAKFLDIANVNPTNGYSRIVGIDELDSLGLKTDNGGSWCRSNGGALGRKFNIHREKIGGKISSVQLVGFKQNDFSGKIDKKISDHYKNSKCRILCVKGRKIEIDHKDGRKQDFKLNNSQTLENFQPLHRAANIAKRDHCAECKKSGIRFDARQLGAKVPQWIGTEEYHGSCIGCYWYDPREFLEKTTANYEKTR